MKLIDKIKQMKKLIILLFITNIGFSQNIDHVKQLDTIYIAFKKHENEKKEVYAANFRRYSFLLKTEDGKTKQIVFEKPDIKDSLTNEGDSKSYTKIKNQSFLRKHKKDIIGIDFFTDLDREYIACKLLRAPKVLYIIDYTEKKKRKIILYRVYLLDFCPVYE